MEAYWNHNTAYHRWLLGIAARHHGDVLDVGCGEGLLVERLAAVSRNVVGIDPDPATVKRAQRRLRTVARTSLELVDFQHLSCAEPSFDVITFVASLHHQPLEEALEKARRLLRPGGELAVVGLAANTSLRDWAWSLVSTPAVHVGSRLHRETADIGVPIAEPKEGLAHIRRVVDDVLPRAVVRRGLYHRYLLHWRNDQTAGP